MTKKFIHHIMAVLMLAAVPAAGRAQNRQPAGGEESTTLLKAALKGVHVELRAGVLIGGTSLVVYPAAGLVRYYRGHKLVVINKGTVGADIGADLVIDGPIGQVLAQV